MRTLRRTIEIALPVLGTAIVLFAVLLIVDLRTQLVVVLLGLLLVQLGVWGLARTLLPNERRFLALRAEVDRFIILVRRLNAAAVAAEQDPPADPVVREIRAELLGSVDRMVDVAGGTGVPVGSGDADAALP